jgi:cyanophycinase
MTIPGRIALVGSGEYLPAMHDVEALLLAGQPKRYVQLATAAAPEGEDSLRRWHRLGAQAAARLGVEQIVIDVRDRDDAEDPKWAEHITGAGLVYLSGAETLMGTAVWRAIVEAWRSGASLAGCSAGAMALAGHVPNFRHPRSDGTRGLGLLPGIRVLPHFDRMAKWVPDFAAHALLAGETRVLGIDEETALVGTPSAMPVWEFEVMGRQSAWFVAPEHRARIEDRIELEVSLG